MEPTYQSTLDYLFQQLPMFQRVGATAFKKDLANILALCTALDQPHQKFPSIHIAGTNGKGSTAHLISAVLQSHGLKVGLYTSPHYRDFRERIKINGKFISKKAVIQFVAQHKSLFEEIQPSFFEITVAMAFHHFAQKKVDIAVIETGLGGRLDSTNIITPILSIITNISFDHQQFLGNTLPLIAAEKAGIIKEGIPVIIGESHPKSKPVFLKKAKEKRAPIFFADQFFRIRQTKFNAQYSTYDVAKSYEVIFRNLKINLHGTYQTKNIKTVFQALEVLRPKYPITKQEVKTGFKNLKKLTRFMGRWQILSESPLTICDSAHNVAGIEIVMDQIQSLKYKELHIVLGMVNDKDIDKILKLLPTQASYYFAKAAIPRGMDASLLQAQAGKNKLIGKTYSSVKNALRAAKRKAEAKDLIYVGGSTFVVAEVI